MKSQQILQDQWGRLPVDEIVFSIDESNKFVAYVYEPISELSFGSRGIIVWYSSNYQPMEVVNNTEDSLFHAFVDLYLYTRELLREEHEYQGTPLSGQLGRDLNLIYAKDPVISREGLDLILI